MADKNLLLRQLTEIRKEEVLAKATLKAEIEARYREELAAIRYRMSRAANQAKEAGASATRIGRAIGTSNWDTIRSLLDLSAAEFAPTPSQRAHEEPWTVNVGADGLPVSVTLHEYKDKATGQMLVADLVVPGKVATDGYFNMHSWEVADRVDWDWITDLERAIWKSLGRVAESKPPTPASVNPGLDLPDSYFAPKWNPSMDEEDA